jgi:hypothetical protein
MNWRSMLANGFIGSVAGLGSFASAYSASATTVALQPVQYNQGQVSASVDNSMQSKSVDSTGETDVSAQISTEIESATASASITVTLSPLPGLTASVSTVSDGTNSGADAIVQVTYHVEIVGEPGLVDLGVQASSSASSSGSGGGTTELQLIGLPGPTIDGPSEEYNFETDTQGGAAAGGFPESFSVNTTYTTQADMPFAVSMLVSAGSGNPSVGSGSATTILDPFFSVPDGYSIELSPGVGNTVPEPSSWAMMLLGFAGLGFVGYRRTRKAVSIAVGT